jgi:hypothetical protein
MEKEFVTYEQALALKELGFDEPCIAFYDKLKFSNNIRLCFLSQRVNNSILNTIKNTNGTLISAPLYQQAFRWLRNEYATCWYIQSEYPAFYGLYIHNGTDYDHYVYDKYEEAESACLDKLIEICKNK